MASVNSMQVKDYIQALADDGKLHVEKIGSGNWYWAWAGEEKRAREKVREGFVNDLAKSTKGVDEVNAKIGTIKEEIAQEKRDAMGDDGGKQDEEERTKLTGDKALLETEVGRLQEELERFMAADGAAGVERKEADIRSCKAAAEMWTDNIYVLEGYLKKLTGGDREVLEAVRRECYGEEYVEEEGLRELEG